MFALNHDKRSKMYCSAACSTGTRTLALARAGGSMHPHEFFSEIAAEPQDGLR